MTAPVPISAAATDNEPDDWVYHLRLGILVLSEYMFLMERITVWYHT
jgi:hypothetical protein